MIRKAEHESLSQVLGMWWIVTMELGCSTVFNITIKLEFLLKSWRTIDDVRQYLVGNPPWTTVVKYNGYCMCLELSTWKIQLLIGF